MGLLIEYWERAMECAEWWEGATERGLAMTSMLQDMPPLQGDIKSPVILSPPAGKSTSLQQRGVQGITWAAHHSSSSCHHDPWAPR